MTHYLSQNVTEQVPQLRISTPESETAHEQSEILQALEMEVLRQELGVLRSQVASKEAKIIELQSELRIARSIITSTS